MTVRYMVLFLIWLCVVAGGVTRCLAALNHALGPGKEVKAISVTLSPGSNCQVEFLNASLQFTIPALVEDLRFVRNMI
ncbi:MAG: hypothetical protein AB1510_02050 [Bacillota bacterium]